jgi:hypothetical protein
MVKWKLLIIMAVLLIPIVDGAVWVQVSKDNDTWLSEDHITNPQYGGRIDETNKIARVPFLDACTNYYIRSKNSTTSWTYLEQKTDCDDIGGINMWELAIVLGILIPLLTFFAFIFMINKFKFSEAIKIFLVVVVLLFNLILGSVIYQFAEYGPVIVDPSSNVSSFPNIMGTMTSHYQFVNYLAYLIIGIIVILTTIWIVYKFAKLFKGDSEKEDEQ